MAFAETSSNSHRAWKDPEQPKTILKRTRVLISKLNYKATVLKTGGAATKTNKPTEQTRVPVCTNDC
jgi:hypothetical protein